MKSNLKKLFVLSLSFLIFTLSFLVGCNNSEAVDAFVPDYYKDYLDERIEKINNITANNQIDYSFYFITDLHWEANDKYSPYLIKKIKAETGIEIINFGGDYIAHDYKDINKSLNIMTDCINSFDVKNYFAIIGNHERNNQHGYDTPEIYDEESNSVLNKKRYNKPFFIEEYQTNKISCLYLDSNTLTIGDEQYEWIKGLLKNYDNEWTVLIFTHMYNEFTRYKPYVHKHEKGEFLDKLFIELGDINCNLAGIFTGHIHLDSFYYNDFNIPVVTTMCDSRCVYTDYLNQGKRDPGTVTEQAFDVCQIDLKQRKVFLTRIGAGTDREYLF